MWNLNGDDIQRAKEELKGRRAAIQARYENELKQLEADIADIEHFERFAVRFVSDFKGAEGAPAAEAVGSAPAEPDVVAEIVAEQSSAPAEDATATAETEPVAGGRGEGAGGSKNSSRWRMRLNTGEAAP